MFQWLAGLTGGVVPETLLTFLDTPSLQHVLCVLKPSSAFAKLLRQHLLARHCLALPEIHTFDNYYSLPEVAQQLRTCLSQMASDRHCSTYSRFQQMQQLLNKFEASTNQAHFTRAMSRRNQSKFQQIFQTGPKIKGETQQHPVSPLLENCQNSNVECVDGVTGEAQESSSDDDLSDTSDPEDLEEIRQMRRWITHPEMPMPKLRKENDIKGFKSLFQLFLIDIRKSNLINEDHPFPVFSGRLRKLAKIEKLARKHEFLLLKERSRQKFIHAKTSSPGQQCTPVGRPFPTIESLLTLITNEMDVSGQSLPGAQQPQAQFRQHSQSGSELKSEDVDEEAERLKGEAEVLKKVLEEGHLIRGDESEKYWMEGCTVHNAVLCLLGVVDSWVANLADYLSYLSDPVTFMMEFMTRYGVFRDFVINVEVGWPTQTEMWFLFELYQDYCDEFKERTEQFNLERNSPSTPRASLDAPQTHKKSLSALEGDSPLLPTARRVFKDDARFVGFTERKFSFWRTCFAKWHLLTLNAHSRLMEVSCNTFELLRAQNLLLHCAQDPDKNLSELLLTLPLLVGERTLHSSFLPIGLDQLMAYVPETTKPSPQHERPRAHSPSSVSSRRSSQSSTGSASASSSKVDLNKTSHTDHSSDSFDYEIEGSLLYGLNTEFIEYLLDLSVDVDSVGWSRHSRHHFGYPYRLFETKYLEQFSALSGQLQAMEVEPAKLNSILLSECSLFLPVLPASTSRQVCKRISTQTHLECTINFDFEDEALCHRQKKAYPQAQTWLSYLESTLLPNKHQSSPRGEASPHSLPGHCACGDSGIIARIREIMLNNQGNKENYYKKNPISKPGNNHEGRPGQASESGSDCIHSEQPLAVSG